ncbi:MAG TPA: 4-hydroxy-3-methylbut-2-enyl diphosphate reductase [candidate division Zixibacteria bacterium]|nr:4-hydroxy-3-methylbut-2-enyl diphosphate reductase [candidate division Zixibacteria bacterium]MDD4916380.1 4-hydroxy-3-methylbut-2-enyl diphosphate reductase [candidate division Zixibacteria bacterium]MDM7972840.1 4-hydroxy-3-methylbut-2-enyl diphosphate reductase [candidate division Zixibacteria bacterium]HPM37685.1 4-hydroxy-3-methylbut-2-enyl diphosphate reductase [candidate division Zixibacteria bacterium]HQL25133.1 4-hydroxy-3-methylbut-2-enyl diphosphate reductase [candidate division Z
MLKKIHIARHHGFCMGVKRAIQIAEETAQRAAGPVTILNEIVHNDAVVAKFRAQGVGQAFAVDDVDGGTLIISAHGVAPAVKEAARNRGLNLVDATCPLVERIYIILDKIVKNGYHVIHWGERDHDETRGVVGHAPGHITVVSSREELLALPEWADRRLGLTVQTTAHMDDVAAVEELAREKWPHIEVFNTICNATTQRQNAVMDLAPQVDMVLVVGSASSANSNRLARIANAICGRGILIASAADIRDEWFAEETDIAQVGVTAGASTPDFLVEEVIRRLVEISGGTAEVIKPERRRRRGSDEAALD